MTRIGLIAYLVLTAASPRLCCCTPGRLPVFAAGAAPKAPAESGCCCQNVDAEESTPKDEQTDKRPAPLRHAPCPCGRDQAAPSILLAAADSTDAGRSWTTPSLERPWVIADISALDAAAPGGATGESNIWPFPTPRDRLRALHIWRC